MGHTGHYRINESELHVKKILSVLAITAALALSGCAQAGTAASLGDIIITQSEVQTNVDEMMAQRAKLDTTKMQLETGEALNRSQVRFLIVATIFDEIAKELKITVSTTEVVSKKVQLIAQSGGESQLPKNLAGAGIAPRNFDKYIKAIITADKLSKALIASGVSAADTNAKVTQLIAAKAKELRVSVNPRYGKWDEKAGDVVAMDATGSAVTPAAK